MDYNQLTVAKLKDELKERDIPNTGLKLKKDYIDRLEQDDSEKALEQPAVSPNPPKQSLDLDLENQDLDLASSKDNAAASPTPAAPTSEDKPEVPESVAPTELPDSKPSPETEPQEPTPLPISEAPSTLEQEEVTMKPPRTSATPEPASSDGNKRKRRSPTPLLSEEAVHKKLKQETDGPSAHLASNQDPMSNDVSMPDAPLEEQATTLQPIPTSHDLAQPFNDDLDKTKSTRSPNERRFKNLINPVESDLVQPTPEAADLTVSPAIHPATRALYIRDLVRPINSSSLRDHLEDIAQPPDRSGSSSSSVEECYVDALRTHAFVLFTSISAASRARASTHARIWPPEPMRKQLWADFFPDERFQEYLDTERASGGSRPSQAKRWELAYNALDDGVDVQLVEAGLATHRASTHAGAANAPPTGPRGSMSSGRRPSFAQTEQRRPSQPIPTLAPRRSSMVIEEASAPFLELDKLFNFTATKPKLYWQPVSEDLAEDRLDELDRETSRDWDPRADFKRNGDSLGRGLDQLKRYTFEDGDVLVDGGPEFGGGRAFARAGNRGRGRRNGDSYRGR
ncbi:hypothetical protein E4T47_00384 [Aureobasidium subglaciale]|nr:hypothetical protein E4T47_00384 [Aureobasidium subglaciale]